jgi:glycosyltransferase 2 family protein
VQFTGIAILLALVLYVGLMLRNNRTIGKGEWSVTLPDGKFTALQIVIGIIDLTFMACAMYFLLPKGADMIPFRELMVVFITAMLLGFASHAPGGMGAFEASMLLALPHLDAEQVVAAIIMFRIYYFLIPFVLALLIVAIREIMGEGNTLENVKQSMNEIKGAESEKKENLKASPLKSKNH